MTPAERAVRALRRGDPVSVDGAVFRAAETAGEGGAVLVISWARAAALRLVNQRPAADAALNAVALKGPFAPLEALAIADPSLDLARPLKGPFVTLPPPAAAGAALDLARHAELLPALFHVAAGEAAIAVSTAEIAAYDAAASLARIGCARLPTADGGPGDLVAYRSAGGGPEHLALVLGTPDRAAPVLVRLHSSCLTGDVLGSLRCDCGPQLHAALAAIRAAGGGVLLYLQQEGRGIGLLNKLRAYRLQDDGFDTLDANERLGFAADARDFRLAAAMLRDLGVPMVRLLTNNPDKVAALEAAGMRVTERVGLAAGAGAENARYLETKRVRAGHLF